ncbi:MAG TPA: 6-bladed beta-propeller [Saprospiraceae bacterium]|nr:6-bladed beta-propeller [Saprospiraceae bacterium]
MPRPETLHLQIAITLLILSYCCFSCREASSLPHIVVQNTKVEDKQDLSDYFSRKTIRVTGDDAYLIPGKVRHFEYFDSTLYLFYPQPRNGITAIDKKGNIKWQVFANSDPISSFTALTTFHFDRVNKKILVFDDQKHRLYTYSLDGKFLNTEEAPSLYINDFYVFNSGDHVYSVTSQKNPFEAPSEKAALVSFSKGNHSSIPDKTLLNLPFYNPNRIPFNDTHDFYTNDNDEIFYHREFDDTLFQIKNLSPGPILTFSFEKNDRRKQILADPNSSPIIYQHFLDESVPVSSFLCLRSPHLLMGYVYDLKEHFTMININNNKTIFNTQNYTCDGKNFSGRLDYSNGILLNQMYAGNYQELNQAEDLEVDTKYLDNSFVYTILTPKW